MPKKIEVPGGMAWCSYKKHALPKDQFHASKKKSTGVDAMCKQCRLEYTRKRLNQKPLVIPPEGKLYCGHCRQIKDKSEFAAAQVRPAKGCAGKNSATCRSCVHLKAYKEKPINRSTKYGLDHHSAKRYTGPLSQDQVELAYCAGAFDAEGSAQMSPGFTPHPFMTFSNNNEVILKTCEGIVGGVIRFHERVVKDGPEKGRVYSEGSLVIASLDHVAKVCSAIMPYLKLKADRCELLLSSCFASPDDRLVLRDELDILNAKCQKEEFQKLPTVALGEDTAFNLKECDVAYLSGFIDGDGWIGFSRRQPTISVSTSKIKVIQSLHRIFGGYVNDVDSEIHQASVVRWAIRADQFGWSHLLVSMSKFLTLKRGHAERSREAIGKPPEVQEALVAEMKIMTMLAEREKFDRVEIPAARKYIQQFVFVQEAA